MKINLVMIVKDEEASLEPCLKSAAALVDEIVIADTGSADRTKEIARNMGAQVWDYRWTDDFAAARNFALEHSDGDWNLVLDADEILRPCSRKELEQVIGSFLEVYGQNWMGAITRYDAYHDGDGISVSTLLIPRLLPRGMHYEGIIHEQPDTDLPCVPVGLNVDHSGYLFEDKGERNLPYLRKAVQDHPEDMYYQFQMAATLRNVKCLKDSLPWFRNFYHGVPISAGYRTEGVLLYLYTLLDLDSPVYLMEAWDVIEKERTIMGNRADFCFICGIFYMKLLLSDTNTYLSYLPEIENSYLKCLKLGEHPELGGVVGTGSFKAAYNLGLWYEVSGQMEKARKYYRMSAESGFAPAKERLIF